ncbi:MAG: trypsin-like peptidase domain-containing protein [Paludibaculum sp.]
MDAEAAKILSVAQHQIKMLPAEEKTRLSDALRNSPVKLVDPAGKRVTLDELVSASPERLTLIDKNKLLEQIHRQQQVVDPSLVPASPGSADAIVAAYQTSRPLEPAEIPVVRESLMRLPEATKSIGRLLWSDSARPAWILGGTVFVTRTNEVATACHVIGEIVDVRDGHLSLRADRTAVVDFSEWPVPISGPLPSGAKTYPVLKLLATGSEKGCDAAVLQIAGAETIPPLRLSHSTDAPKRMLVVGYPQFDDLNRYVCGFASDPTMLFFCNFMSAHPGTRRVASPGNLYTSTVHDGLGIFTYSANTRGGQSGSPVLDLKTMEVAGIHYCCTGTPDSTYTLGCATWHPQNVKWNEALSAATILADKALKDHFEMVAGRQ